MPTCSSPRALLAGVEDAAFRARMLGLVAIFRLNAGLDALPQAEEALAASLEAADDDGVAGARTTYGTVLVAVGRDEEGLEELVRAGRTSGIRPRTLLRNRLNHSDALHLMGRYDDAVAVALDGLRAAETYGMERSFGTYLEGNAAESMLATGQWSAAADLIADAVMLDPPSSHRTHVDLLLAWLHLWRDELELADAVLREHRALALSGPDQPMPQFVAQLMRIDGEFAVLTGEARARLGPLPRLPRASVARRPAAHVAPGRDGRGGRSAAGRRVSRGAVRPGARGDVGSWARPPCHRCGSDWPRRSSRTRARTGRRCWACCRRRRARCTSSRTSRSGWPGTCRRLGTARGLKALLDEALPASRRVGARLVTNRLSVLAQRMGVAQLQSGGTATPLAALTARELEVLRLVGAGRSNKEIGDGALHQHQDRERARLQHPGQARRVRSR